MDYIEDYRLIKCLRDGVPTDMNVYDAAALSAVVHLTEQIERPPERRRRLPGLHARQVAVDTAAGDRACLSQNVDGGAPVAAASG